MFRGYIEWLLGDFGTTLLRFYEANSLWINLIVLLYGALIFLSWNNLKVLRRALIIATAAQMRQRPELAKESLSNKDLAASQIPWESVVSQIRFPFVAHQASLVPHRLTVDTARALLTVEDLAGQAYQLYRQGGKPKAKKAGAAK